MPFLLSSDKQVVNAVNQAAWSPGKDLIACLTQDSQLHAYREYPSFQRIWALSFQSKPTTMCWRPDGIRLAVGHEDGSLSIIDAENGNSEMQIRPQTDHGIACLAWASAPAKGSTEARLTHDMWNRYTRHCPWQGNSEADQAHTASAKGAPDNKAPPLKQRDLEVMDILCMADTAGDICLAAFGHYTFLKFSLHDVLKTPINGVVGPTPKCVPQTMLLCPAISRLFVTYGTQAETSKAGAGTLGMVVCSLDMVGSRLKELHSLLLIATELRHLHSACKAAMTRMLRSKQSARNTLLKVFALFGSEDPSMAPGGQNQWESTKDMFRHELQALFSRGQITDQLHVFLTTRPGEHGLKQAARTCDAALSSAHAASSQLHSALQSISFLLEELSGLLTASPAYVSCNISASEVESSQERALQLLVRLEALQRDITSTAQLHRVFFQRLATASRNASGQGAAALDMASNSGPGEEQHALQTFLQYHLETDSLLSEMQEDKGRTGAETAEIFSTNRKPLAPRNVPVALRLMGVALGHSEPNKQAPPAALSSVVDSLGQRLQALFSNLPEALCSGVVPQCKLCLSGRSRKYAPCGNAKCMQPYSESNATTATGVTPSSVTVSLQVCCALAQKKSDSVAHVSMQYDPAQPVVPSMCGAVLDVSQHDAKQMVVDAHPFQEGALVLLTKATGEDGVFSSRRSRGKENLEGVISLIPCPFEERALVPLHSAVQQDVLQELIGAGGLVKLENIADVGSRSTPSGQVNPPLAVSVARGLATVCAEQRITVYDLLDAEDGEGEEEEENGAAVSDDPDNDAASQASDDEDDSAAM